MRAFLTFVLLDGLLLFGLFYLVTFLIALAQQHSGVQDLSRSLRDTGLVKGSLYAAIAGAITPFCSCSTVPMLSGMIRARIRFGVCMTFLLSSPLVDTAVVIVMARYFGALNTVLFVVLSSAFSIVAGILLDLFGFSKYLIERVEEEIPGEVVSSEGAKPAIPWRAKMRYAEVLARNELRGVALYILAGLMIGGLIYGFVPESWILAATKTLGPVWLVPAMALIATPLYLNVPAAVPVAFALTQKHVPLGAVIAFLVAGGGISAPEIALLLKMFRPPLVAAFVVSVLVISIAMGYIFMFLV